jgi:hypothetical protein
MFIAVINENFQVAEEAKRGEQASNYWASYQVEPEKPAWIRNLNPYRWVKPNPVKVRVENLPSNLVLPIQKALVQDYTVPRQDQHSAPVSYLQNPLHNNVSSISFLQTRPLPVNSQRGPRHYPSKSLTALQRFFAGDTKSYDVPLATLRHARTETAPDVELIDEETERHL